MVVRGGPVRLHRRGDAVKHRLVPIAREPDGFDTRTGWRCVYCGKQWQEIDANAWFEDCPVIKEK